MAIKRTLSLLLTLVLTLLLSQTSTLGYYSVMASELIDDWENSVDSPDDVFNVDNESENLLGANELNLMTLTLLTTDSFYSVNLPGGYAWAVRGNIDGNWNYLQRNRLSRLDDNLYAISYVKDAGNFQFMLGGDDWGRSFGVGNDASSYSAINLTLNTRSKVTFYFKDSDVADNRRLYVYVLGEDDKTNAEAAVISSDSKITWYAPENSRDITLTAGTLMTALLAANSADMLKFVDYNCDGTYYTLTRHLQAGSYTATTADYGSATINIPKAAIVTLYIDFSEPTQTLKYSILLKEPKLEIVGAPKLVQIGNTVNLVSSFTDEFGAAATPTVSWTLKTDVSGVSITPDGALTVGSNVTPDTTFTVVATVNYNNAFEPPYNKFYIVEHTITAVPVLTEFKFNYLRFNGDYDGWNLWAWQEGELGQSYPFDIPNGNMMSAVIGISGKVDKLNFITRKGNWADQEGGNRVFDKSKGNEVWLVQGDTNVYYSLADAMAKEMIFAVMDSTQQVRFKVKGNPTSVDFSKFAVYQNNALLNGTSSRVDEEGIGVVTISSPIDPTALLEIRDLSGVYKKKEIMLRNVLNSYMYTGNDLGFTKSGQTSSFNVWAPTAKTVSVAVYNSAGVYNNNGLVTDHSTPDSLISMTRDARTGVWTGTSTADLTGKYYMYKVEFANGTTNYAVDPYARAVSANGQRGAIVNLTATNPTNWKPNEKPQTVVNDTDHVLYELHVRDFSIDPTAGFVNKGKYLAFTETGLTYGNTEAKIGIDHLKQLGVTTVQLMPVFDFYAVNELAGSPKGDWGYNPVNFNVPEGSYSTNPSDPTKRINEFKQMVQALHDADIRVVMDVAYTHTFDTANSAFNKIVPGYYYRTLDAPTDYANGSGQGNEIATERAMVRKFILDSVKYWAREYNIDGFKFSLMGLLDTTTASMITSQLKSEIDPTILVYGEPWQEGGSPLMNGVSKGEQKNQGYAVFNDNLRTAMIGYSDNSRKGFATGESGKEDGIVMGIKGATDDITAIPSESINHVTTHDNLNLYDKVVVSNGLNDTNNMLWQKIRDGRMTDGSSVDTAIASATPYARIGADPFENNVVRNTILSTAMLMTMQGIPFFQAGDEFLKTKYGDSDSYTSPDSINMIRWANKADYLAVSDYYAGLIQLRRQHPAFRLDGANIDWSKVEILNSTNNLVAFQLKDNLNGDSWKNIVVIYNGSSSVKSFTLPTANDSHWHIVVHDKLAGTEKLGSDIRSDINLSVGGYSVIVLYDEETTYTPEPTTIELRDTVVIEPGKTENLKITVRDQNGKVMQNQTITGESDNDSIATYSNGKVTAIAKGTATITLTCGSATKTLTVKVMDLSVSVTPTTMNSRQNGVISVTATDVTIKSISANLSALGGSYDYAILAENHKVAFGVRDYISAGEKTITVKVTDTNNNEYYFDKTITVADTLTSGFDWDEARIYSMLTDRFFDGNATNNTINNAAPLDKANPGAYHGGDFVGVTQKLDYLKDLGINTIWLSPIVSNINGNFGNGNNGDYYAYHGYWADDFTKLSPLLGTRADLEALIDGAHDRGMKIMVSVVLNHAGYETESLQQFTGMFRATSGNTDETATLAGLPDFKTEEAAVRNKLIEWQTAWAQLKTAKGNSIDYFYLDSVKHIDYETWWQFKSALAPINAEHKLLGEVWADDDKIATYLNNGILDSALDFAFKGYATAFLDGNIDVAESNLEARNGSLSNIATKGQFLSFYDEDRFLYTIGDDTDKMRLAATLQITTKGQPIVYYGEEIGMTGENNWPTYDNRKDFDWTQVDTSNTMLAHYTKLLNIRADYSKLFSKGFHQKTAGGDSDKFLVFARGYDVNMAYVGINQNDTAVNVVIKPSIDDNKILSIKDVYNDKTYTPDSTGQFTMTIPAINDGGTAIVTMVLERPLPPEDNDNGNNDGDNDGNNNNGGGSTSPVIPNTGGPTISNPLTNNNTTSVTVTIPSTGSGNTISANLTAEIVNSAIKAVVQHSQVNNTAPVLQFYVQTPVNTAAVDLKIPYEAMKAIADVSDLSLTFKVGGLAEIRLCSIATSAVYSSATSDVVFTARRVEPSQSPLQGRPCYEFNITSGGKAITNFKGGKATIVIPYTPQNGEKAQNVVVYYVDESGKFETVKASAFNKSKGVVTFITHHFSKYLIGYNEKRFNDVSETDWFADTVSFVAARSMFEGFNDNFDPYGNMTRAMFVAVLARLDNADLSVYKTSAFLDAPITEWYGQSAAWAKDKGILSGYDNGLFAPNDTITREQMAVMLTNYVNYKGINLPANGSAEPFSDSSQFSPWAVDAINVLRRLKLMNGVGANRFNPLGRASRAETAQIFANYLNAMLSE